MAIWRIEPRDPLVTGNGAAVPALVPRDAQLPFPGTVAGLIRSRFLGDPVGPVAAEDAREVVEQVSIRGLWLERDRDPGVGGGSRPWVPAPRDAAVVEGREPLRRARVERLAPGEGVHWPEGVQLLPVLLPERDEASGQKLDSIVERAPFWPLEDAVRWALGGTPALPEGEPLARSEHRVHVSIDPKTGTAAPSLLFGSAGLRLGEGASIAVAVVSERHMPAEGAVLLGGEGRPSYLSIDEAGSPPPFAEFERQYAEAAKSAQGLRLQLLTPGCFDESGWRPPEIQGLALRAALVPEMIAISGWDYQLPGQHGGPRSVRRLVPAGAVYYFEFAEGLSRDERLDLCRRTWFQPLAPAGADPDARRDEHWTEHRAPPEHDGYGLVLPGFWSFDSPQQF